MMLSIEDANNIYRASSAKIKIHSVDNLGFYNFCNSIKILERNLGPLVSDEIWQKAIKILKYFRYEYCSLPLPYNCSELECSSRYSDLTAIIKVCKYTYSQIYPSLLDSYNLLNIVKGHEDNPIFVNFLNLHKINGQKHSAILLKDSTYVPILENYINSLTDLNNVEVVSVHNLKSAFIYNTIYVIGPSYWYPDYVFTSPRAQTINIIKYKWIFDRTRQFVDLITDLSDRSDNFTPIETIELTKQVHDSQIGILDPKEIIPSVNWELLSKSNHTSVANGEVIDQIEAKLFLLDGGMATYLDIADNAKALVIDLNADEDELGKQQRVKRVLVRDIHAGMFVLLRTGGGGDLIAPIADRILGNEAESIRLSQQKWKNALRAFIKRNNLFNTCIDLIDNGAFHANETNLRNWASDNNNIRPADDRDFEAIMNITGLDSEFSEIKNNADKLLASHQRAGAIIRKLLLSKVNQTNLRSLEKTGLIEFKISSDDDASITVFRVKDISPEKYLIPIFKHAQPFKFETYVWQ